MAPLSPLRICAGWTGADRAHIVGRIMADGITLVADRAAAHPDHAFAALRRRGLSPLGLGCARIGSLSGGVGPDQARAIFAVAAAHGITLFDTAGIYGGGDSERSVGAHARAHPGTFVMTKIGRDHRWPGRLAHRAKRWLRPLLGNRARHAAASARQRGVACDFSVPALQAATRAALRRIAWAPVDALLLHSPPAAVLRDPAVAAALAGFKADGAAEWVGVSCDDIDALRAAIALDTLDIVQVPLALYRTAQRDGLVDRLVERGTAIILRGVLSDRGGMTVGEALAAAIALPGVASVLAGVSSAAHLEELVGARGG
jgi:aryl-alcohol dehydrogenase-like predicted oxidoreductase